MNKQDIELLIKANEWYDSLEESQKNAMLDKWILQAYKEMIEE